MGRRCDWRSWIRSRSLRSLRRGYNEASLVKTLEEKGIGRPSTYASIINTIQDRDYVKKIQARFVPTEIGTVVTELLVKNFPYIFDTAYTATLESELDAVEEGTERWTDLLNGFYDHFEKELKVAERARWKTSSGWSRRRTRSATSAGLR